MKQESSPGVREELLKAVIHLSVHWFIMFLSKEVLRDSIVVYLKILYLPFIIIPHKSKRPFPSNYEGRQPRTEPPGHGPRPTLVSLNASKAANSREL